MITNVKGLDDVRRALADVAVWQARVRTGTAVLVGGTVTVNDATVTADTRIFAFCQTPGGTPGWLQVSTRTAGASFTLLSSSGTDTSTVAYLLIEPQ